MELGIPVVVALNKSDINERKDMEIDETLPSEKLGCPVIKTVSTSAGHAGLKEVVTKAAGLKGSEQKAPYDEGKVDLHNKSEVEEADRKRFEFVKSIVASVEKRKVLTKEKNGQDKIDAVLTNPCLGIPIFAVVMFGVFYISQTTVGTWIADWLVGWIEAFREWAAGLVENANPFLQSLLVDGMIGGVGAVVGFLPLIMVMYFLIALLEDCGYMARATAMLTPFMPCGAKLPVIALFVGAFFLDAPWGGTLMYFVGILLILLCALLVNAITGYKFRKSCRICAGTRCGTCSDCNDSLPD